MIDTFDINSAVGHLRPRIPDNNLEQPPQLSPRVEPHSPTFQLTFQRLSALTIMSAPRNPPFRAEHLGSLKRPDNLLAARRDVHEHKAASDSLPSIEDQAIKDIVKIQQDCGFHAISDGEYRRHMFWGTFFPSLKGFTEIQGPDANIFRPYVPDIAAFLEEDHVPGETVICTGKIEHTGKSSYIEQFEYLKSIVPKEQWGNIKLTLAAPNWYHLRYKTGKAYPKEVYANDQEYFHDIAKAYQTELQILYDAGLRNAQVDDPNLACTFPHHFFPHQQMTVLTNTLRLLLRSHARRLESR